MISARRLALVALCLCPSLFEAGGAFAQSGPAGPSGGIEETRAAEGPAAEGPAAEGPAAEGPAAEGPAAEGPAAAYIAAIAADPGAAPFSEALGQALAREFLSAGFAIASAKDGSEPLPPTDDGIAAAASDGTGARWIAVARCSLDNRRLVWRIYVYDAADGAMIASGSGGAFAGASALSALDDSALSVAMETAALAGRSIPEPPMDGSIRFSSPDEGASIRFGPGDGVPAGFIEAGSSTAPYVPFATGSRVVATVAKEGYWPKTQAFSADGADEPVALAPLMLKARHALSLGLGLSRLAGASVEYRFFPLPDAVFSRVGAHSWLYAPGSPGALLTWHNELRLSLGAYLLLPRDSRFRVAAGVSASGALTTTQAGSQPDSTYFDLSADVLWTSLEWHWPALALFVEQRVGYSFGLESGLLRRGWLQADHNPFIVSAGVIYKWR